MSEITYDLNSPEMQQALKKIKQQLDAEKIKDKLGSSFEVRLNNNQFEICAANSSGGLSVLHKIDPHNFKPEQGLAPADLKQIKTAYAKLEYGASIEPSNKCVAKSPKDLQYFEEMRNDIQSDLTQREQDRQSMQNKATKRRAEEIDARKLLEKKQKAAQEAQRNQENIQDGMQNGLGSDLKLTPRPS